MSEKGSPLTLTGVQTVSPGPKPNSVCLANGTVFLVPQDWELVPPGDPALTRRIKAVGPALMVKYRVGRREMSGGIWTLSHVARSIREQLDQERATPAYAAKQASAARRRERVQAEYVDDFESSVRHFLKFAPQHAVLAAQLAEAVARHATPVGSGTVARTERIPIERRAEAAVIAWMRHQTTAYDHMTIKRVKGNRRAVRRQLAEGSRQILNRYRKGGTVDLTNCPLALALIRLAANQPQSQLA